MSARRFLAEGPQAVREALACAAEVDHVFATAEAGERHAEVRAAAEARGVDWLTVDEQTLASVTDTVVPQGLVAVCAFVDVPLDAALGAAPRLVAIGANVRDPGNAGNLIRSCDAVGADAVVLAGTSVDPYNGKAVRSSVGSLFHLPVVHPVDVAEAIASARAGGLQVLAADGGSATSLDDCLADGSLAAPTAWLFGNEAWGLPAEIRSLADRVVAVPIYGRAESLNLATAAAVCLYTSARAQRA